MITAKEKSKELYSKCFSRFCHELSHDKNHLAAKAICLMICDEVLGYMGADRGYEFWSSVKYEIQKM